ncbi:MAG: hypothetical protein IJT16_15555 [Lachnospiraceae bacterium]|nr:hypothetical protein [Lachnospiraceae bacterium]
MEKIIAAKDTDGMYDAVQKLTDNQKDIAIVSLIKMMRGETPMGWDIQTDDLKRMIREGEI